MEKKDIYSIRKSKVGAVSAKIAAVVFLSLAGGAALNTVDAHAEEVVATTNSATVAEKTTNNITGKAKAEATNAQKAVENNTTAKAEKVAEVTTVLKAKSVVAAKESSEVKEEKATVKEVPATKEEKATAKETPAAFKAAFNTDPAEESATVAAEERTAEGYYTAAPSSELNTKSSYIRNITAQEIEGKRIKYTINTNVPFDRINYIHYANVKDTSYYTSTNYYLENFDSRIYRKINDTTFELTTGPFVSNAALPNGDWRLIELEAVNKSGNRIYFNQYDLNSYRTSVLIGNVTREPEYVPTVGNKKAGVFTNYSTVKRGDKVFITVKSSEKIGTLHLINTDNSKTTSLDAYTGKQFDNSRGYIDSKGNQVFIIDTDYLAKYVGLGNYTIKELWTPYPIKTISSSDLNLSEASFRIVEVGSNVRRAGNHPIRELLNPVGWIKEGNNWYYKKSNGTYAYNTWVGNYYVKSNGTMASNEWFKVGNTTYYAKGNGTYARNTWVGDKYVKANGAMAKNEWVKVGNTWYYAKNNGDYAANTWVQGKYYVKANGAMAKNEWFKAGNSWYYAKADGTYARSEYVDGFYVYSNGTRENLAGNKWTKSGNSWYYVKGNGDFAKSTWVQGKYYVKANGRMAMNEWFKVGNTWYYAKADGSYARNERRGEYFLKADGAMAINEDYYWERNLGPWDYSSTIVHADKNGHVIVEVAL